MPAPLLLVPLVALGAYGGYRYFSQDDSPPEEVMPPVVQGMMHVGTVSQADVRQAKREAAYAKAQARQAAAETREARSEARSEQAGVREEKARGKRTSYQVETAEAELDVEAARRGEDYTPGDNEEDEAAGWPWYPSPGRRVVLRRRTTRRIYF